jgi:hypothetical protein
VRVEREVGVRTAVDVKAVLQAVDGGDLALAALVAAADNLNLILRKVSTPLTEGIERYLHPCGWECCVHRAFRGAPYSVAPEDCQNMSILDVPSLHTLMMTRRTLLGALKCAFRDLRRELATIA